MLEETETKHTKSHNGTNISNENIEAIIQKVYPINLKSTNQ